ncbi:acyl-CoA reductase-like NAD-dependent aldehyde dehydrogenase [Salsuginibacillus halophilus]|uniref:3-sulfolactaldehyde dehydrogenase n=1 Tax=Salsuginibacillus halophilus TaxID=517424 RepID=A0A2P8HL02_9BACI|nr:aldehyde dehydrogenase family protein [Salsuginibacillus halophilus]PSL46891.1 acyl-CoA reductase-like NAD-dependent aldehyde dehydrogenase [Salsuginibacillus halophilus]
MSVTEQTTYGLFINGAWDHSGEKKEVLNKYTQKPIGEVVSGNGEAVSKAVAAAKSAQQEKVSPYERYEVLMKAAAELRSRTEELAVVLAEEVGKPINESRGEVGRAALTLEVSAEEAKRIEGETVAVEAAPGSEDRRAYTKRVPVGVIAAITPFNVPLNLVCHKVGPALAAGNSVVLKPAEATPISALKLAEIFQNAGLPAGRLNVVTGRGSVLGDALLAEKDIHLFTFTGSPNVGRYLKQNAGLRDVALELGNNSATMIHHDTDVAKAAAATAQKSFNNAGQVCISVQRVYVHESIYDTFLQEMKRTTEQLNVGDPKDEATSVGPMIAETEAKRIESWVEEAKEAGAVVQTGGWRDGAVYAPTILTNVHDDMKVCREETFGPVVAVDTYQTADEAIARINDSDYGLQAGVFTNDFALIHQATEEIEVGGVIINDTPGYRVDHMPYGGVKESGTGKEGPKYAIREMTEERLIVMKPQP